MLKNLFKRKPSVDDPNPTVRKEVVERSKDLSRDKFAEIARTDADVETRKSALARVNSVDLYAEFLDHDQLGNFCRTKIAEKVDEQHHLASDLRILPLRLSKRADPQQVLADLNKIESSADQAKVLVGMPLRALRLDVTNLIHSERTLVEIEKSSRAKDKNLNRLVRDKLQDLKTLEGSRDELLERAERAISTAQSINAADAHYDAQRTAIEQEWDSCLQQARSLNQQLTTFQRELIAIEPLEQRFPARLTAEQTDSTQRPQFDLILKHLKESPVSESSIEECETAWLNALKIEPAPKAIADQFYQLANAKRRELKKIKDQDSERTEIAKLVSPLKFQEPDAQTRSWRYVWRIQSEAKARLRDVQQCQRKLRARPTNEEAEEFLKKLAEAENHLTNIVLDRISQLRQDIVVQIESNFASLNKFLEGGELQRAQSAERNIAAMIQRLPRPAQGKYKTQLAPISAEIKQLFGWQQFAESPKRQVLCEEVEELVENPLAPQEQFNRIRDLREAWNQLGPPRSREDRDFQTRYEGAAAAAFKVCEAWFQKLAEVRAKNLEERTSICESLESFLEEYDWDHADWKAVNKTIRTAQSEWRKLIPIDKRYAKKINTRFRQVTGELESRLEANWTVRAAEKQALIDEVKAALADENSSVGDLIDFVKTAQERWRDIGSAGNQREQPLWEEFRNCCNEAFDLRTTQREQRRSEINENIEQGEKIVADLESKVLTEDATLTELDMSLVNQVRNQLTQLDLPQRVQGRLNEKIKDIAAELKRKAALLETQQTTTTLRDLLNLDDQVARLEQEGKQVSDDLTSSIPGATNLFQNRSSDIASKSTITIHELVLRAEVLADVPSPTEDSGKRMQVQVARLQHGLTRGGESDEQRVEHLIQEWCKLAYGEQPLRERFQVAIRKHLDSLVA
ncbi:MAG: DUF349 domain-containing protein [Gammaproteobacteria bacterium]|nr:DUF349 domain-containing protein [Gammaproteobacteria bacterium]